MELTQEHYERVKAARLTRYSREEILAVAQEYEAAEAEVRTLSAEANRQLDAFIAQQENSAGLPTDTIRSLIRWTEYLDEKMAAVYDALCRASDATRWGRGSGAEFYPVSIWRKAAASQRAAARRLHSALKEK